MYLWRKSASQKWWNAREQRLRAVAGERLAIIERPNRKRSQIEVGSNSRVELEKLAKQFGGKMEKLPRDWLKRFTRTEKRAAKNRKPSRRGEIKERRLGQPSTKI